MGIYGRDEDGSVLGIGSGTNGEDVTVDVGVGTCVSSVGSGIGSCVSAIRVGTDVGQAGVGSCGDVVDSSVGPRPKIER